MRYHVRGISVLRDNIGDSAYADPGSPTGSHPRSKIKNGVCFFSYVNVDITAKSSIFIKNLLF